MSWIRNTGFYILHVPHRIVHCHRFDAGSGALNINGDPDPDPTLFYICWKIRMVYFYSQETDVPDYSVLSILIA
jgi:hypothetical protein